MLMGRVNDARWSPNLTWPLALALAWPLAFGGMTRPDSALAAPQPRYAVRFANGERMAGDDLTDWYRPEGVPKLNGRTLLDAGNPLRWMINRSLPLVEQPRAFVETHGGDQIPGRVTSHLAGDESFHEQLPPHFVVAHAGRGQATETTVEAPYRVASKWVRRIVWERRRDVGYHPSAVFLRDGGRLDYRVARFSRGYVTLLLADGTRKIPFPEIAELHLPQRDAWELYLDELALLAAIDPLLPPSPPPPVRLMQVETVGGLVATTSLARLRPRTTADPKLVDRWLHGIQPAWSLDTIWVPHGDIRVRRLHAINEVPLSRLFPSAASQISAVGSSPWPFRVNLNTRGGPLRDRDGDFGWGFGVHATSELRFPLHPLVSAFRTGIGLDQVAGQRGCIRARVMHAPTNQPNHQTGYLTGANPVTEIDWLPIQVADDKRPHELILQVDMAHDGRPAGADPLDIRDIANWVDPLLQLDAGRLTQALAARLPDQVHAWDGWRVVGATPATLRRGPRFLEWADTFGRFEQTMVAVEQPLALSRRRVLTADDRWLVVNATRSQNGEHPPRLQIRIGGEIVAEEEFPLWDKSHLTIQPIVVSLANYQSPADSVEIELLQLPGSEQIPIEWHSIHISSQHPALYELYEDDTKLVVGAAAHRTAEANDADQAVFTDAEPPHSGIQSLRVDGEDSVTIRLPAAVRIRERPQPGEYRFIRFAFRKEGGTLAAELQASEPGSVRRYEAGPEPPEQSETIRVWAKELPAQWIPITRDLFGDFREFDLRELTLETKDGKAARFDHIYLARTQNEFLLAAPAPQPDEALRLARRELAKPIRARGLPAVVALEFGDGRRATGTIISAAGEIITAGHHVVKPQQDVSVRLADQRVVRAKTLGVCRDLDLGLIAISDAPPFPFVDVHATDQFPSEPIYLGVAHREPATPDMPPEAHLLGIRRVFQGEVWTDFDVNPATTGGPLFGADSRLMGVHARFNPFGGVCYTHFQDWPGILARLKKSEVWGTWRAGTGPMLGVEITNSPEGCSLTKFVEGSPAASAGLHLGDVITKVDGEAVTRLAQVYTRLAAKDPGQTVSIGYRRGASQGQLNVTLMPRIP